MLELEPLRVIPELLPLRVIPELAPPRVIEAFDAERFIPELVPVRVIPPVFGLTVTPVFPFVPVKLMPLPTTVTTPLVPMLS